MEELYGGTGSCRIEGWVWLVEAGEEESSPVGKLNVMIR